MPANAPIAATIAELRAVTEKLWRGEQVPRTEYLRVMGKADPLDDPEREWNRAYEDAMQWRDWQTCEILIEEREQADWWKERERED